MEGAKDPNRHEADTLHDFLTNYESGGSVGKGKGQLPRVGMNFFTIYIPSDLQSRIHKRLTEVDIGVKMGETREDGFRS